MYSFYKTILFIGCLLISFTVSAADYYVSSAGSDSNPATEEKPWRTIDKVNRSMNKFKPGDKILFRRGDRFFGELRISASGTKDQPLVFGSCSSGDLPVIYGTERITDWTQTSENIWTVDFSAASLPVTGLIINREFQPLARYPDSDAEFSGYLTIEEHSGKKRIRSSKLKTLADITGCEAVVRTTFWLLDRINVSRQDGEWIDLEENATYELQDRFGFFLQNHPSFLSRHGEWFYDPAKKQIMLYWDSSLGLSPADVEIEIPTADKLLTINGPGYLEVRELHIYGSRKTSVNIFNCHHINFHDNRIELSAEEGFNIYNAQNFSVNDCMINNTQSVAFQTGNFRFGDFTDNIITNTGIIPGMGMSGICKYNAMFLRGDDYTVRGNRIYNTGYMPMDFSGNNVLIENNVIDNYCFVLNDGGGIYAYWGSRENQNRVVSGNIITGGRGNPDGTGHPELMQVCGIYMDEAAVNVEIKKNIITGINGEGIYIHNASSMYVHDNISANNRTQFSMVQDKTSSLKIIRDCRIENNIFFAASPDQLLVRQLSVRNDLFHFGSYKGNSYHLLYEGQGNIEMEIWPGRHLLFNDQSWSQIDHSGKWFLHGNDYYTNIAAAGDNKILSSTFDMDTGTWGTWSRYGSVGIFRNNDNGDGNLKFVFTTLSGRRDNEGLIFNIISNIREGEKYLIKFECRAEKGGRPYVLSFRRHGGDWRDLDNWIRLLADSEWTQHEFIFSAGFDADDARIDFNIPEETGAFWLDNVSFVRVEAEKADPEDFFRIEINDSDKEKAVALVEEYTDIYGNAVSETLQISPFSAEILIKDISQSSLE